jgi:hypothetical protein
MVGRKFGRLEVQFQAGPLYGGLSWLCICECGKAVQANGAHLRRGSVQSCGCLRKEALPEGVQFKTHGQTNTGAYKSWQAMHQRCSNPKSDQWGTYGGRGISVCQQWGEFEAFFRDMGPRPKGMTIDREDSDGNYEPTNCRWASPKQQSNNRRNTVFIEHAGQVLNASEFARTVGLSRPGARNRMLRDYLKGPDGIYRHKESLNA